MAKILGASRLSSKFQITVTEPVRHVLEVKAGDTLAFVQEDGKVYLAARVKL